MRSKSIKKKEAINLENNSDENEFKELALAVAKKREEHKKKLSKFSKDDKELFHIFHETLGGDKDLDLLYQRLNYQRVVDKMDRDVKWWKWSVLFFALLAGFGLYLYGNHWEHIITKDHGLDDYEQMISSVDREVNHEKTETFPFTNQLGETDYNRPIVIYSRIDTPNHEILANISETFFNMYFMKYLLVRFLLIIVLVTLITSGIKVYMRMRKDRMAFIVKEEATTTTLYLLKKFLSRSSNTEYSTRDKQFIEGMLPKVINELYYMPNIKDLKREDVSTSHKLMGLMEKMTTNVSKKGSAKS